MSLVETTESPRPEVSLERLAGRHAILLLKQMVKADAVAIRSAKRAVRAIQRGGVPEAGPAQSGLSALRRLARLRLLVYGFARGRTWAQMEPNRPAGDRWLAGQLLRVWREAEEPAARVTGVLPPLSEQLRQHTAGASA